MTPPDRAEWLLLDIDKQVIVKVREDGRELIFVGITFKEDVVRI